MARYRSKADGTTVDAVQFTGRLDADVLAWRDPDETASLPTWLCDAMNAKTVECSAIGLGLILNVHSGSHGLAKDDWVMVRPDGQLGWCRGERFAEQYERVYG